MKPKNGQGTSKKLGITEKLLAMNFVKGLQPTEAAVRLSAIGLKPSEIAPILGKTANAITILLSRARQARSR